MVSSLPRKFLSRFHRRRSALKSNGQREKGSNTLFLEQPVCSRSYDKEISLFPPLRSEKNGTSGSVEHVPGIGRRTFSTVENSEESGARMYMRADVEIFLKGTAGQDAEGGWGWRTRGGGGKSLTKGAHLGRAALPNGERGRKMEEVDRVRCATEESAGWSFVRSFVREGSVLGSRNMA